jgi:hypothetical protein
MHQAIARGACAPDEHAVTCGEHGAKALSRTLWYDCFPTIADGIWNSALIHGVETVAQHRKLIGFIAPLGPGDYGNPHKELKHVSFNGSLEREVPSYVL